MTGIFKANNPSGNAILFFYAIALKLPVFMHPKVPPVQPLDGVLYKGMLHLLDPVAANFSLIYPCISFLLIFIQAISFNRIVNTQRLHKQPNYLTAMSYILITSLFSDWFILSAPMLVNTLMIWIWSRLCTIYNNPNPKATIFNIGLATGLATFFYFPSVAFLVLVMAGIAIARPFRLQEWLTGLAGIITPVYFFGAWLFLTDSIGTFRFPGFHLSHPEFHSNIKLYTALGLIAVAAIAGLFFVNTNISRQVVQTRKSWQLLFIYLAVAALVPFINAGPGFSYWILPAVPLAPIIAAAFFYPQKRVFPMLLHWAMVAVYIWVNFI